MGAEAWMIAARPESSRVSPHERNQNGTAVLNTPTTTRAGHERRSEARIVGERSASGASVSAPRPIRPQISVAGVSSRTPTLMNMNDEPQIAERASSISRWRRLTVGQTYSGTLA